MKILILCICVMSMALSGAALAVACVTAKRIRRTVNGLSWLHEDHGEAENVKINGMKEEVLSAVREMLAPMGQDISNLKSGLLPDYEAAKDAAKAMNDFSEGLSAILAYDPAETLRAKREQRERG